MYTLDLAQFDVVRRTAALESTKNGSKPSQGGWRCRETVVQACRFPLRMQ